MREPRTLLRLASLLPLFILPQVATAFDKSSYGPVFKGDLTYYGGTSRGNCAIHNNLPPTYRSFIPLAMNHHQYDFSRSCGACLHFKAGRPGTPLGNKLWKGYVMDRCPECHHGSIDLGIHGDGRWPVKWWFMPCPNEEISLVLEGSNQWYKKVQVRGTAYPTGTVSVAGQKGERSQDNFFIAHGTFPSVANVVAKDIVGNVYSIRANIGIGGGHATVIYVDKNGKRIQGSGAGSGGGSGGSGGSGGGGGGGSGTKCVAKWKSCSDKDSWWRTRKCCTKGWTCRKAGRASSKKCRPPAKPRAKCAGKWKLCSGPRQVKGKCCSGLVCRHPRGMRYRRCLPKRR